MVVKMTIEQKANIKEQHIALLNQILSNSPIDWKEYYRRKTLGLLHCIDLMEQGEITKKECIEISNAIANTF